MAGISDYSENRLLDYMLGNGTPTTVYVALYTTNPNFETGSGGTEVSGGSYARPAVTNNSTNWPAASSGSKSNGAAISFATPSASWGTVTGFALWDSSGAGNMIAGAALTTSKTINSGDTVSFAIGDLVITLD